MGATAKSYNTALVELGPGDIWLDTALPGAGLRVTVDVTAGVCTPESVANPSAKHLGMTAEGAKLIYSPNLTNFESDEQTAPIITQNVGEELRIEGTMLQLLDTALITKLIAGATYSTAAGYEQNTVGGKQTVATFTILYLAPIYADTTKFLAVNIYKAYNAAGWQTGVSRKKMSGVPFNFFGLSISTRAAGDQLGNVWKSI